MNLPPPAVTVSLPLDRTVTDYNDFTGRTAAIGMIQVRARVTGYLLKSHVQAGDMVKKGQVLFEIDPRPYRAELDRAEATIAQAEARFKRLDNDAQRAKGLKLGMPVGMILIRRAGGDRHEHHPEPVVEHVEGGLERRPKHRQ